MSEQLNLWQKMVEIRKVVTYLQKENDGAQYKYVSSSQVLTAVRAKMDELCVVLVPSIVSHKVGESVIEFFDSKDRPSKRTTTYFTELDMSMTWVNGDNPSEKIECSWYAQGVDIAGEKGVGKALTYGEKYFMLRFFNIPTDKDDPDAPQLPARNEPYSPPRETGKKDAPTTQNDDLAAIEKASDENMKKFSEISDGQLNMLKAKAGAAGFKAEDKETLMTRSSAFLGYRIDEFSQVKKADVTRLAQFLDRAKKVS